MTGKDWSTELRALLNVTCLVCQDQHFWVACPLMLTLKDTAEKDAAHATDFKRVLYALQMDQPMENSSEAVKTRLAAIEGRRLDNVIRMMTQAKDGPPKLYQELQEQQ